MMAIYRLLQRSAFSPEDVVILVKAYERSLRTLNIPAQSEVQTEAVAKAVIEIAQTGVRDPDEICARVVDRVGPHPGEPAS